MRAVHPERVVAAQEEMARVIAALNELPERTREVFMLQRLEHMTYPQIAEGLGMPLGTVEAHDPRAGVSHPQAARAGRELRWTIQTKAAQWLKTICRRMRKARQCVVSASAAARSNARGTGAFEGAACSQRRSRRGMARDPGHMGRIRQLRHAAGSGNAAREQALASVRRTQVRRWAAPARSAHRQFFETLFRPRSIAAAVVLAVLIAGIVWRWDAARGTLYSTGIENSGRFC